MSRVDQLLESASGEMREAVGRMPEREGRTVEQRNTRRNVLTGVATVVLVIVVGFIGWQVFGSEDVGPIDDPESATTIAFVGDPIPADPDAEDWSRLASGLAGTYRNDSLSVPFSATLEGTDGELPWMSLGRSPWEVGLGHPNASELGDRELVFMVAERLSDPQNLRDATWPVGDIEGWIDAAGSDVVIDGPTNVAVAGRPALRFTMKALGPCTDDGGGEVANLPCDTLAYSAEGTGGQLFIESSFAEVEVWWVPNVDGDSAFVAFASAYPSSWNSWGPAVESVVDSLGIG